MHWMECHNIQVSAIRKTAWEKITLEVTSHTAADFTEVFLAGMNSIVGGELPNAEVLSDWPEKFRVVFQFQTEIGWEQILFGRIAHHWDTLAPYSKGPFLEIRPGRHGKMYSFPVSHIFNSKNNFRLYRWKINLFSIFYFI